MLTVVGIISVLVSVSIPVINNSLRKAQEATDAANERAAKGAALTEYLSTGSMGEADAATGYSYFDNAAGKWTAAKPAPYGKCKEHEHQSCYLKGKMNSLGEVEIKWTTNGTDEKQSLCSETLMAESSGSGGSTPSIPELQTELKGDFNVSVGANVAFDDTTGVLTIKGGDVTIRNSTTTTNSIVVKKDASANITLENVNIDVSGQSGVAAFKIEDNSTGDVKITLSGDNTLQSGAGQAGLQKNGTGGTLTIEVTGTLTATGGSGGAAGIGGANGQSCEHIIIRGGTVDATGDGGAGIGGGVQSGGSDITIINSKVTATGKTGGTGIGGGDMGSGSNITISDNSDVTAMGSGYGAGIGGNGTGSGITISNSKVTATGGSDGGTGIGGYVEGKDIIISDNSNVTATGKNGGAGIGGGAGSNITISGSTVTAEGSTTSDSSEGGAGIGGGHRQSGEKITIENNSDVTATGGVGAAGIGGGKSYYHDTYDGGRWYYGNGTDITITNSTVTATGGGDGAKAIGGGKDGSSSGTITNSTVNERTIDSEPIS